MKAFTTKDGYQPADFDPATIIPYYQMKFEQLNKILPADLRIPPKPTAGLAVDDYVTPPTTATIDYFCFEKTGPTSPWPKQVPISFLIYREHTIYGNGMSDAMLCPFCLERAEVMNGTAELHVLPSYKCRECAFGEKHGYCLLAESWYDYASKCVHRYTNNPRASFKDVLDLTKLMTILEPKTKESSQND